MSSWDILCEKNAKQLEKQVYELRRTQVTTIKGKISEASDNCVQSINSKIDGCANDLSGGIKGIGCLDAFVSLLAEKKEVSGTTDEKLNSYNLKLCSEIGDCNCKIDALESTIKSLEAKYQQALKDEEDARRRALEEAMKKLSEMVEM